MSNPHDTPEVRSLFGERPNLNTGIQALFNGDMHAGEPLYAPREDWVVLSPSDIVQADWRDDPDRIYRHGVAVEWAPIIGAMVRRLRPANTEEQGSIPGEETERRRSWKRNDGSEVTLIEDAGAERGPEYELIVRKPASIIDFDRDTNSHERRYQLENWHIVPYRRISRGIGTFALDAIEVKPISDETEVAVLHGLLEVIKPKLKADDSAGPDLMDVVFGPPDVLIASPIPRSVK